MMFKNIPHHRLVLYILICGLLPVCAVLFYLVSQLEVLDRLKMNIEQVSSKAFLREQKQATNMAVQSFFKEANHSYLDKEIETIPLLQPETQSLQKIVVNPNFTEDEGVKKRLEFLSGKGNRLVFSEGVVQSTPVFQEVVETLVHPVEVNTEDLKNLLAKIEGKKIDSFEPGPGRPQLMIVDFKLERKSISDKNDVYLLNLKLVKREFL